MTSHFKNLVLTGTLLVAMGSAFAADPIKVGLLEDISGDLALIGKPKLNGSQLAVEEINKSGGIMGRQIELIHLDPQGDRFPMTAPGRRDSGRFRSIQVDSGH